MCVRVWLSACGGEGEGAGAGRRLVQEREHEEGQGWRARRKEKKNTTRLPFLSFLPFSAPRAPAKGPTHTRRPYDHVQVVRLPEGGGRPGRLDAAAPAPAVRRREAALADGGEGARRRRVPLCPSLTPLPFSPCARDYPVTADEYELLEECGRGVSATVSENGERERAGERGGGGGGPPSLLNLSPLSFPLPSLSLYRPHRSGAPCASRTTRSSPSS